MKRLVIRCEGSTSGAKLVEEGPFEPRELADLFSQADLNALAGAWPACVADALAAYCSLPRGELGAILAALNVVADRLHKFDPARMAPEVAEFVAARRKNHLMPSAAGKTRHKSER